MNDRIGRRRAAGAAVRCAAAGAAIATVLVLGACWQNPTGTRGELRNEEEYAAYRLPGTGVIEGQVLIDLPSGEKLYGGECQVRLLPVTTSTRKYFESVVLTGEVKPVPTEMEQVSWLERADALGRFRFINLPGGNYYVICPMAWVQNGATREGIAFAQTALSPGEKAAVVVTRGTGSSGG
ncbi:MAG TPA: hypothetical protein VFB01_18700 [Burkholderiales bacterium]|nr:hypothetical protein [Burkholderiales bacterium]